MYPFREYEIYKAIVPGPYTASQVQDALAHASEQVGFLILFIKNESDTALNDITITYNNYQHPEPLSRPVKQSQLGTKIKKNKIIKHIQPREEMLLLLEIYRKGENGYPLEYFASVDWPEKLTGRSFGSIYFDSPNRDKAAKIPFPFGWSGQ